jgi:VanZ family protein
VRNIYLGAAVLWSAFIALCCLVSMNNFEAVPLEGPDIDKYVHGTFYFVFTFLWFYYFKFKSWSLNKRLVLVFIIAVLFGIAMEICQSLFTDDRSADLKDVLANTTGSAIAVVVLWLLNKQKK